MRRTKQGVIMQVLTTVISLTLFTVVLFRDLPNGTLPLDDIPAASRSIIAAEIGDDLDTIEMLDHVEIGGVAVELYAITRKDGHESRYFTTYRQNPLFRRYQSWYHTERELGEGYLGDIDGFPHTHQYHIDDEAISLETTMNYSRDIITIILPIGWLINLLLWIREWVKYRRGEKEEPTA